MAKLGFFQSILAKLISRKRFADIEAETRSWRTQCPKCHEKFDAWDVGGIIWKKTSDTHSLIKCPHCGRRSTMTMRQSGQRSL